MENKELYKLNIKAKIDNIKLTDDSVIIIIGEKEIIVSSDHEQNCCESVYADFSPIKYHVDKIINTRFFEYLMIKGVKDMGFLMCFYKSYGEAEKVFIPCYNSQNGYYSDELLLVIEQGDVKTKIDITEFKEDIQG